MSKTRNTNKIKETNMKKTTLFFVLSLFLLLPSYFYAQHEMVVPPATSFDDVLNNTINNDVDGSGNRLDPERVYVLQDGIYFVNGSIVNDGWPLTIVAEAGSELKPLIISIADNTNTLPSRLVDMRGNVTLKNIRFLNYYESISPEQLATATGEMIRSNASGFNIVIDHCIISDRSIINTTAACVKVQVTNTVMANMFRMAGANNWGDNKGVDFRNSSCDSAIFINNTFVNEQDRIVRQRGAGDGVDIQHFIFDHNTVINNYGYHGCIEIGRAGKSVQITNNVFYNPFCFGNDSDIVRQSEFEDNTELDPYGGNKMVMISTIPNDTTQFTIRNNFVTTTQRQEEWYTRWTNSSPKFPYSSSLPEFTTDYIKNKIDYNSAFTLENITMGAVPVVDTSIMSLYRDPIDPPSNGGGKTKIKTPYTDFTKWDCDRKSIAWLTDTLDATYNTDAAAYTGADGGQPAGALNWWGLTLGVKDITKTIPTNFSLKQNYPNPFNPTTNIQYSIPKETHVTVEIFDILGRVVTKLVNTTQKAGTYNVDFDASKLASGAYIYRLSTPDVTYAKKMLLMK
jgi:Secretion system C-terminal sorting domain